MDFVAFDFETANEQRASPCAVGLTVVKDGILTEKVARLIRPSELRFNPRNTSIHGIRLEDVADQPEFPEVWNHLRSYFEGGLVLAHCAAFDVSVLMNTLRLYSLPQPEFRHLCTRAIAKAAWPDLGSYTLSSVAQMLEITFHHHDAADDAFVCAEIARRACAETASTCIEELVQRLGIAFGESRCCESADARRTWHAEPKAADYLPSYRDADPSHPLFGRVVVFTGPLVSMHRSEAMQRLADLGGSPGDSVTKKTDFLVVGGRYFDVFAHKTGKVQKALGMIAKGSALDIIGEDDFLKMLDE